MSLQTLRQFQTLYQQYTEKHRFQLEPQALYEPIDYILNLGGKQLRPVLLLMAHHLFSDNMEAALPAAYAIEIFHNFTLLHDDIMDEAPLRRGKPTVHHLYNVNTGILSGDVMLIYAYEYLLKTGRSKQIGDLVSVFNRAAIDVCEGQQFDMNFETTAEVSLEEYLKMIELKTASLIACAIKLGAMIGHAKDEDVHHLTEFGRHIGIAFQLQDDILDTFGDPKKFGKKVGGDIAQNKKTYLYLKALEVADEVSKKNLLALYQDHKVEEKIKIEKVVSIFNLLNIRNLSESIKDIHQQKAFEHLNQVCVETPKKEILGNLALQLLKREK